MIYGKVDINAVLEWVRNFKQCPTLWWYSQGPSEKMPIENWDLVFVNCILIVSSHSVKEHFFQIVQNSGSHWFFITHILTYSVLKLTEWIFKR